MIKCDFRGTLIHMQHTSQKKKVLFCITKSNWGGAQRHVYDVATSLPKEEFDVAVLHGGEGVLADKLHDAKIRTIPIHTMARDISIAKEMTTLRSIFRIIKQENPDILHLHSPKAAGLGSLCGRILGIRKIIYTVHGWAFNEDRPWWQKKLIYFFSWCTVLFCHNIITITPEETHQTRRFPFFVSKITYIPNGIQPPEYITKEEARRYIQEKSGISLETAFVIGIVAELHRNKGLTDAIMAVSFLVTKFPHIVLVLLGEGEQRKELESIIKEKNLSSNILLLGFTPHASIYMNAYDVFLLPSIKEGLPYVLLEAALAGLPTIATRVGGIPDLIRTNETGILVAAKNPEEISRGIVRFYNDPIFRKKMGEHFKNKVEREFSFHGMLSNIIALYKTK